MSRYSPISPLMFLNFAVVTATSPGCPVTYGYAVFPTYPARRKSLDRLDREKALSPKGREGREPASIGQHRADVGLGHRRAVHPGVAVKPPHGLAAADRAHVILHGVAGHHGLAKLAFVDGEKIHRARPLGAFDRLDPDHAGGLRHGLDHHHAGIDRSFGKMTLECRLVEGDVLDADAGVIAPDIDDAVDQQHRIAMRERPEDIVDIHQREPDRCLPHYSCPSPFGSVELSRTRRSSATISRNHCRVGLAKWPPQRPPAGMSSLTALIAVTWAPSPMWR